MNQAFLKTRPGAWLNLCRISNLPSAWSNILMGSWLARQDFMPTEPLWLLLLASSCFYIAGMILNDVFDFKSDCELRPERPIPSGLVSLNAARCAGFVLLAAGIGFSVASAVSANQTGKELVQTVSIAILLATAIVLYDSLLKKTVIAPIVMGSCRSLNILLGASLGYAASGWFGFSWQILFVSVIVGVYVSGITWFARHEAEDRGRAHLIGGALCIMLALGLIHVMPFFWPVGAAFRQLGIHAFLLVVTLVICWRMGRALWAPQPARIQQAVVICLLSLILFDALFVMIATPEKLWAPMIIVSLLILSNLLGKIVRPT